MSVTMTSPRIDLRAQNIELCSPKYEITPTLKLIGWIAAAVAVVALAILCGIYDDPICGLMITLAMIPVLKATTAYRRLHHSWGNTEFEHAMQLANRNPQEVYRWMLQSASRNYAPAHYVIGMSKKLSGEADYQWHIDEAIAAGDGPALTTLPIQFYEEVELAIFAMRSAALRTDDPTPPLTISSPKSHSYSQNLMRNGCKPAYITLVALFVLASLVLYFLTTPTDVTVAAQVITLTSCIAAWHLGKTCWLVYQEVMKRKWAIKVESAIKNAHTHPNWAFSIIKEAAEHEYSPLALYIYERMYSIRDNRLDANFAPHHVGLAFKASCLELENLHSEDEYGVEDDYPYDTLLATRYLAVAEKNRRQNVIDQIWPFLFIEEFQQSLQTPQPSTYVFPED